MALDQNQHSMGIHRNPRCGIPEGAGVVLSSEMGREGGGMLLFSECFHRLWVSGSPTCLCPVRYLQRKWPQILCSSSHLACFSPPPPPPPGPASGPGHVTGFDQWDTSRWSASRGLKSTCNGIFYSVLKRNEILTLTTTWMDLRT